MKKLIIIAAFFSAFVANVDAQIVSLNNSEARALRYSIDTNKNTPSTYKKAFEPYLISAQKALIETPNPIEKILSQGLLEGNPQKIASLKAVADCYKVYSLAIVYKLYGEEKYLDKAQDYLLAWSKLNKATGDPINETKLEDMVTAYDLIRDKISSTNKAIIDAWMESIADTELNSESAKPGKGTAINNWNSHRIKMIALVAYTLHTHKYDTAITTALEKQLEINLNADGTTHDFVERDAFHYHTYDLEPLLTACIAIYRATGKDYFNYKTSNGASIKNCVDFMVPFMTGEKTHGEFVKSTVPFDVARAKNHEKGYEAGTQFDPKSGIFTLSLAAYFDPRYIAVIRQAAKDQSYFNWQLALDAIKKE